MTLTGRIGTIALLCCASLTTSRAQDALADTPILRMDQAVALALAQSPERGRLDARLARQQAARSTAGTLPNPGLGYTREDLRGGDRRSFEWTIAADYPLLALLLHGPRVDAADADVQAESAWNAHARTRLSYEVKQQYLRVWQQRVVLRALRETEPRIDALEQTIADRAAAGEISPYERARLRTALSAMQWRMATAAEDLRAAESVLAGMLALTIDSLQRMTVSLPRLDSASLHLETLLRAGRNNRKDLAALRTQREARAMERAWLRWSWMDDIRVGGGYKEQSDAFSGPVLTFTAPLPLFDRGQGQVRASEVQEAAVAAELAALERSVDADIRSAAEDYLRLRAQAMTLQLSRENAMTDLLAIATEAYREGEFSLIEYLDALSASQQETELDTTMRVAVLDAAFRLEFAVGQPLFSLQF